MALAHPPPHFFPAKFGTRIGQKSPFPAVQLVGLPFVEGNTPDVKAMSSQKVLHELQLLGRAKIED